MLISLLVIAICAIIAGADYWEDVEEFGKARDECGQREDWNDYASPKKQISLSHVAPAEQNAIAQCE